MTAQDRVEKFTDCAGRVLGRPGAERLLRLLECCAELPDVREMIRATVPVSKDEGGGLRDEGTSNATRAPINAHR
jgi:hypothetical protein